MKTITPILAVAALIALSTAYAKHPKPTLDCPGQGCPLPDHTSVLRFENLDYINNKNEYRKALEQEIDNDVANIIKNSHTK